MAIGDDFVVDFNNRVVKHTSGTTVYTVNALYSYIQDYVDEVTSLTYTVPMSAQTPTEYTLINSWFIPEDSFKYLKGGSVRTDGWNASTHANGVFVIRFSGGYVGAVPSDIGKVVTDGVETGVLLDYDNTLQKWWVRKTSANALSGSLTIVSGTGAGTILSILSGEALFSNIYSLGLLDSTGANLLYVEQINPDLPSNLFASYWPAEHIDIIIKVREAGSFINSGIVRVFCREYTDLYSHFTIDISTGGRNPVPLGTSTDSNNQTASGTVATWSDVTITFGSISRDLGDGSGFHTYDVEIDCGTRTSLQQVYERLKLVTSRNSGFTLNGAPGQFYRSAQPGYAESTQSPFGTFAGGQFFGARGVWLTNVPSNDSNNYQVTAADGVARFPPFASAGSLIINSFLASDPDAELFMYFTTNPSGNFGTGSAVTVNDFNGVPIAYAIGGASTISWTFAYDTNVQGGRTAGTDAAVTVVALGRQDAQYVLATHTITRSVDQNIRLDAAAEQNYDPAATYP